MPVWDLHYIYCAKVSGVVYRIFPAHGGRRGPYFERTNPGPRTMRLESFGDEHQAIDEHLKNLENLKDIHIHLKEGEIINRENLLSREDNIPSPTSHRR